MADGEGYAKIIVSSILGGALGIAVTYSTGVAYNRETNVRLSTQIESLTKTIEVTMDDRYTGSDSIRDFALVFEQIKQLSAYQKDNAIATKENALAIRAHLIRQDSKTEHSQ